MADVVKSLGVTEVTCYRRRQKFGGTLVAQAWSMKQVAQAASGEAALQQHWKAGRTFS